MNALESSSITLMFVPVMDNVWHLITAHAPWDMQVQAVPYLFVTEKIHRIQLSAALMVLARRLINATAFPIMMGYSVISLFAMVEMKVIHLFVAVTELVLPLTLAIVRIIMEVQNVIQQYVLERIILKVVCAVGMDCVWTQMHAHVLQITMVMTARCMIAYLFRTTAQVSVVGMEFVPVPTTALAIMGIQPRAVRFQFVLEFLRLNHLLVMVD